MDKDSLIKAGFAERQKMADFFNKGIRVCRDSPEFLALLFRGIANGSLLQAIDVEEGHYSTVRENLEDCWRKYVEPKVGQLCPQLQYPQMLPIKVR